MDTSLQSEQCVPSVQTALLTGCLYRLVGYDRQNYRPGSLFCLVMTSLHTEQCFPSVRPFCVQVASTAWSVTIVCPQWCYSYPSLRNRIADGAENSVCPSVFCTGCRCTFFLLKYMAFFRTFFCSIRTWLQTEQCFLLSDLPCCRLPLLPCQLQHGVFGANFFCFWITSLQTEQCFPSVRPLCVQVGVTPLSVTIVWPFAGVVSVFTSLQFWQVYCTSPVVTHPASWSVSYRPTHALSPEWFLLYTVYYSTDSRSATLRPLYRLPFSPILSYPHSEHACRLLPPYILSHPQKPSPVWMSDTRLLRLQHNILFHISFFHPSPPILFPMLCLLSFFRSHHCFKSPMRLRWYLLSFLCNRLQIL